MFHVSQIKQIYTTPPLRRVVRAWDIAATEGAGDYTAGIKIGELVSGGWCLLHAVILQGSPDQVDAAILKAAEDDGRSVSIQLAQDPGSAGKRDIQTITRKLAGYPVKSERVSGSKETRARGFASQVNLGNFSYIEGGEQVRSGPYAGKTSMQALLSMLRSFPSGTAKKDGVDAAADAFNALSQVVRYGAV